MDVSEAIRIWKEAGEFTSDEIDDFVARRGGDVVAIIKRKMGLAWFDIFNSRIPSEARPGQAAAHRNAERIISRCEALLLESPADFDIIPILSRLGAWYADDYAEEGDGFDDDESSLIEAEDLPELIGTSAWSWTPEETGDLLVDVLKTRDGLGDRGGLVNWLENRLWTEERQLAVGPVTKEVACTFIRQHHSSLPNCNRRGMMFAIGAFYGSELVAVATAGTPTGRWGPGECSADGTLELTRIASRGGLTRVDRRGRTVPVNASSALASRLMDLLPESGRGSTRGCRFVTYSLTSERSSTYLALVAKGLRPVAFRRGSVRSGARADADDDSLVDRDKIVWEYGPAARPPDWSLVDPSRRAGAIAAFGRQ